MPRSDGQVLARWSGRLTGVDCTPLEFFELVQVDVLETQLPDIRFARITRRENGPFSANRIYFRVRCDRLFFDVTAFVSGRVLAVGYWLHADWPGLQDLFFEFPFVGSLIERAVRPTTYYGVDQLENFQHIVHDSILRVLDDLSSRNSTATLPDDERQPIWEEIR